MSGVDLDAIVDPDRDWVDICSDLEGMARKQHAEIALLEAALVSEQEGRRAALEKVRDLADELASLRAKVAAMEAVCEAAVGIYEGCRVRPDEVPLQPLVTINDLLGAVAAYRANALAVAK